MGVLDILELQVFPVFPARRDLLVQVVLRVPQGYLVRVDYPVSADIPELQVLRA